MPAKNTQTDIAYGMTQLSDGLEAVNADQVVSLSRESPLTMSCITFSKSLRDLCKSINVAVAFVAKVSKS
ncbi:MAG TPA: hypothetical protein EYQ00_02485 [Dehalococcoidia bacterium]|nr:hypothetical protein [Dehalococcoidia bacterium]